MNAREEAEALIVRFDWMRNSGVCSPTTRSLLDDAQDLLASTAQPAPTPNDREALSGHMWYITRWGGGNGGYGWKCSCGIVGWGTGVENPARYVRHASREAAALVAVEHIAAGFRRVPTPPTEDERIGS